MKKSLLIIIGTLQFALGIGFGVFPHQFLGSMGHSHLPLDLTYEFGMMASRFWVYGAALIIAANQIAKHRFWILAMAAIQAIDLSYGLIFTFLDIISLRQSLIPMVNAVWIMIGCIFIAYEKTPNATNE